MKRVRDTTPRAALWLAVGFFLWAPALTAQASPVRVEEDADCGWSDGERDRYCEVREYALEPRSDLTVDAGLNGGIEVTGWDRDEVRLVARVHARSQDGDPRDLARAIEIRTGSTLEATGPRTPRDASWSVSFDLRVPRSTALRLQASNGGIHLEGLTGQVEARTTNGGIQVVGGAGEVRGTTTNGGLHIDLLGQRWEGAGVDLRTTNGGVVIQVPDSYSAVLETGTVNGPMDIGIPVTVQGRIDRLVRTTLGDGGPLIRLTTTNGGVRVTR